LYPKITSVLRLIHGFALRVQYLLEGKVRAADRFIRRAVRHEEGAAVSPAPICEHDIAKEADAAFPARAEHGDLARLM